MNRLGLALLMVLAPAGITLADAYVELVPTPAGPYSGGETVHIDLNMWQDTGADLELRGVQFCQYMSDPALQITNFEFDYSSLASSGLYTDFVRDEWDCKCTVYIGLYPVPGMMLTLPADGSSFHLVDFDVILPSTLEGSSLILDMMNYSGLYPGDDEVSPDYSARVWAGFPRDLDWGACYGDLHGGVIALGGPYSPEPGSAILLLSAFGVLLASRRTRHGSI